jgi:hypothetical protein
MMKDLHPNVAGRKYGAAVAARCSPCLGSTTRIVYPRSRPEVVTARWKQPTMNRGPLSPLPPPPALPVASIPPTLDPTAAPPQPLQSTPQPLPSTPPPLPSTPPPLPVPPPPPSRPLPPPTPPPHRADAPRSQPLPLLRPLSQTPPPVGPCSQPPPLPPRTGSSVRPFGSRLKPVTLPPAKAPPRRPAAATAPSDRVSTTSRTTRQMRLGDPPSAPGCGRSQPRSSRGRGVEVDVVSRMRSRATATATQAERRGSQEEP